MCSRIERLGESKLSNEGYKITIVRYGHCDDIDIKFENDVIFYNRHYNSFTKGNVSNPFHPTVFGVGYLGFGDYKSIDYDKSNLSGETWRGIIKRSYSNIFHIKNPAYKNVTVCEEWHNFQNFAKWYEENYNPETMENFHLDKDILIKGNKIYSPETCCIIPQEINNLLTNRVNKRGEYPIGVSFHKYNKNYLAQISSNNIKRHIGSFDSSEKAFQAYKIVKEEYIKELAEKWKSKITEKVYEALYNYQVEITD
jgi:hypothetical protein